MNPRDSQGPLNHGITSHAYDTVVRQPESGWAPKQAQAIQAPEFTARPLKSAFHLATRNHDGRLLIPTQVLIISAASFNGKEGFFSFSRNEGEGLVGVLLNVRTLPQMYPDVSFEKHFFEAKDQRCLQSRSSGAAYI